MTSFMLTIDVAYRDTLSYFRHMRDRLERCAARFGILIAPGMIATPCGPTHDVGAILNLFAQSGLVVATALHMVLPLRPSARLLLVVSRGLGLYNVLIVRCILARLGGGVGKPLPLCGP